MDKRYDIKLEWCGLPKRQYVIRFCGNYIGSAPTKKEARIIGNNYERKRT